MRAASSLRARVRRCTTRPFAALAIVSVVVSVAVAVSVDGSAVAAGLAGAAEARAATSGSIWPSNATADADGAGRGDGTAGLSESVLFSAGSAAGTVSRYACFRIPSVVRTVRGTLLAFAEARRLNCGDATDIDVVLRRSVDNGRTWTPLQVVNAGGGETHGNPEPVVDRANGRIHLATTYNKSTQGGQPCAAPCDRTPHLQYSDDDGATWSTPEDLTATARDPAWNSWYATGPNHGVQLESGPHAGRLVLGVNAESSENGLVTANYAALVVSDDHGATWHIGARDRWPVSPEDGTFRQKPSELALVQLADGSLYAGGREESGTDLGARDYAISTDGGDSFARPFSAVPDLYAPGVEGSLLRIPDRLLLASPADPARRRTMEIRASYDGGRTWEAADQGRIITTDWSGYSDLVRLPGTETGLLYEGGAVSATDEIRFARFTDEWLGGPPPPYARTPDLAPGAPDAYVLGGAHTVRGPFGDALSFDGVDDGVRLPYRPELPLGEGDFTVSLWVRMPVRETSPVPGPQPLLSMGGVGPHQPQVTISAEAAEAAEAPGSAGSAGTDAPAGSRDLTGDRRHRRSGVAGLARIDGTVVAQHGPLPVATASVGLDTPYDNGQWHFVALRRTAGRLTLTVDGGSRSVADVPGSVSETAPFGVHIGQAVDGRSYFTGDVDEVRVYATALTASQLGAVRTLNADAPSRSPAPGAAPVLRLPFDTVRPGPR